MSPLFILLIIVILIIVCCYDPVKSWVFKLLAFIGLYNLASTPPSRDVLVTGGGQDFVNADSIDDLIEGGEMKVKISMRTAPYEEFLEKGSGACVRDGKIFETLKKGTKVTVRRSKVDGEEDYVSPKEHRVEAVIDSVKKYDTLEEALKENAKHISSEKKLYERDYEPFYAEKQGANGKSGKSFGPVVYMSFSRFTS